MCIRVLIVDDQPRSRRSLKALLTVLSWNTPSRADQQPGAGLLSIEMVGEAENGREAIEQVQQLQPDVVVMDLHPAAVSGSGSAAGPATEPRMDGVATIQMIKSRWPAIRIVVLTMYATDRVAVLAAGADAFLLKGCSTSELLQALIP